MKIDPDTLYIPKEVAEYLRCGKTNIYDLLTRGELAVTKIGAGRKGLRVKGSDLLEFLAERREGGPTPAVTHPHLEKFLRRQAGRQAG